MSNSHLALILAISLVSFMVNKNTTAHGLGEGNDSYIVDSSGHLISDGYGDCAKTGAWSKDHDLEDCGAVPEQAAIEPQVAPVIEKPPAPVAVRQAVSLSAGALFDVNSDSLKDAGKQELSQLAASIKAMQDVHSVNVVGHTDSSGAEAYNQGLSQRRANAVKDYLVEQGVSPTVISTVGMGESQPVTSNTTRDGRAKNRRVEITIEGTQGV